MIFNRNYLETCNTLPQLFMRARVVAQGVTVAAMMSCLAWQGMQKDEKAAAASAAAASKRSE